MNVYLSKNGLGYEKNKASERRILRASHLLSSHPIKKHKDSEDNSKKMSYAYLFHKNIRGQKAFLFIHIFIGSESI